MSEKGANVITWGADRPGIPPNQGMEVFGKALAFYDELAKEGRISGYRVYASTASNRGMLVIEGDAAELARLSVEPESTNLLTLASAVVEDVHSEIYIGGKPDDVVSYYTRAIDALNEAGIAP